MDIGVGLKVIEVYAPAVARTLDEPVAMTIGGLALLWHRSWSTKADRISRIGLQGVFGPDRIDLRIEALTDAGFLEAMSDGTFRIRGAERYLRIRDALSRGGHASKGNLIPGGTRVGSRETSRADSPDPSREIAEEGAGLNLGLTPITDHRSPISKKPARSRAGDSPDPRHAPLVKDLTEAFQQARGAKYPFDGGRDAKLVSNLLARAEPGPLLEAWKRALRHEGYPTVATLADFDRHLPRFLGQSKSLDGRDPEFDHAASWGVP